jgi:regulator of replication initiation timing
MCIDKEEIHAELAKCEERIMRTLRKELESMREATQESIIDRNSVHMLLERMKEDNTRTHTLAEQILAQTTRTNGRVTTLEGWKDVHMKDTEHMAQAILDFKNTVQRVTWIIVTAVAASVLALVLT